MLGQKDTQHAHLGVTVVVNEFLLFDGAPDPAFAAPLVNICAYGTLINELRRRYLLILNFLMTIEMRCSALLANLNNVYIVYMGTSTPLGRRISVRLPEDLRERVEALARATRRSLGDVVREVLERELSELEWEQRIVARAVDLRPGRDQAVPLAVIEHELGLSGALADASILDEIE